MARSMGLGCEWGVGRAQSKPQAAVGVQYWAEHLSLSNSMRSICCGVELVNTFAEAAVVVCFTCHHLYSPNECAWPEGILMQPVERCGHMFPHTFEADCETWNPTRFLGQTILQSNG